MADLKTTLRELSVVVGLQRKILKLPDLYEAKDFFSFLDVNLAPAERSAYSSFLSINKFDRECLSILENGYLLSEYIILKLSISKIETIKWLGFLDNRELPYDIEVNGLLFSLKENSFILENMGLYKLLNCFTGSNYPTRHIFEDYAYSEYDDWFQVAWNKLVNYLKNKGVWKYYKGNKNSTIILDGNNISFSFTDGLNTEIVKLPMVCSISTYKEKTNSTLREQVFSKFINKELKSDPEYIAIKKRCSTVAADNVAKELIENLNYKSGIARFLRFHEQPYYYAKVSNGKCCMFYVDSDLNITKHLRIESITPSVPDHQANILTSFKNLESNKTLVLRNELRFSHGQFNGTPEAKLYIASGDLLSIYKEV